MNEMKPFLCKDKKHRLGMIRWNGDGIPQLILYRRAVDLDADHPAEVDVIGTLSGSMSVRCDICNEVKPWKVSMEVLLAMADDLGSARMAEFAERLHRQRARVAFE